MAALSGKLTRKLVDNLGQARHGDGNGLYLVVDPSGARRWIVRVVVKGQRNRVGGPLRTDFGLGGADIVTLNQARDRALEYRRMAKQGLNPRFSARQQTPTFAEVAQQVHIDRLPIWKNAKHGQQWINTLRDHAFPKIGRMPVDSIGQPEVLMCLSPIWTDRHETAKRLAQRIRVVLDVARSKGFRSGENPVTAIREEGALPKVKARPRHHGAMRWQDVPAFYADLATRNAMAARALMFTCLTGSRTGEVLGMTWPEVDFDARLWTCPADRMKGGELHRVPLTDQMLSILEPLRSLQSDYVFEGQKRHRPLSNMSMLMLLRRMKVERVTVHAMGVLTLVDRAAFAAYCAAYARWVEAERKLRELPAMVRTPSGYVQQNPWIGLANKQLELMGRYMAELGLTPAARSRIVAIEVTRPNAAETAEETRAAVEAFKQRLARLVEHERSKE